MLFFHRRGIVPGTAVSLRHYFFHLFAVANGNYELNAKVFGPLLGALTRLEQERVDAAVPEKAPEMAPE